MKLIINGKSESDKKSIYERLRILRDTKYSVEIKEHREKRSLSQQGYYFVAVIKTLADYFGYTAGEMHEILKNMFLPTANVLPNGQMVFCSRSTKALNTKEYTEYIEQVRAWAASEFNINIPDPTTTILSESDSGGFY